MSKKLKKEKIELKFTQSKGGTDELSPLFSFEKTTNNKKYNFENLSDTDKLALVKTIYEYKEKSWITIKQESRHDFGSEKIDRKSIKIQLPSSIKEDTTLLILRYNKLKPMVGYRDNRIFYILYFDPKFKLYDHGKK